MLEKWVWIAEGVKVATLLAARKKRLRDCRRRLNNVEMHASKVENATDDPLLVGSFRRRLDASNHLTLPKQWIRRKDGLCRAVWLGRNPADGRIVLLLGQETRRAVPHGMSLTMLPVDARGRIRLNDDLVSQIGAFRSVTLIGRLRYAEIVC